jgi:(4-O-methyl)-D-glucuronate---lignin esterase
MNKWLRNTAIAVLTYLSVFAISAVAQGGELVAAEFGAGNRRVDVTPQVRSHMHDGVLQLDVEDRVLGVDPAFQHVKELFIRIRHWDGQVEEFRFPEHAHVNLVLDPERGYEWHDRDLHIMRAFYGGAGHFADVTETVRGYQHEGRVNFLVDNSSMGGDPDPAVHKVLRVLYWHEGQRRQIVVPEQNYLRLP